MTSCKTLFSICASSIGKNFLHSEWCRKLTDQQINCLQVLPEKEVESD